MDGCSGGILFTDAARDGFRFSRYSDPIGCGARNSALSTLLYYTHHERAQLEKLINCASHGKQISSNIYISLFDKTTVSCK